MSDSAAVPNDLDPPAIRDEAWRDIFSEFSDQKRMLIASLMAHDFVLTNVVLRKPDGSVHVLDAHEGR